jgi:hypothetical protein
MNGKLIHINELRNEMKLTFPTLVNNQNNMKGKGHLENQLHLALCPFLPCSLIAWQFGIHSKARGLPLRAVASQVIRGNASSIRSG